MHGVRVGVAVGGYVIDDVWIENVVAGVWTGGWRSGVSARRGYLRAHLLLLLLLVRWEAIGWYDL